MSSVQRLQALRYACCLLIFAFVRTAAAEPDEPGAGVTPAERLVGWTALTGPQAARAWRRYRGEAFPSEGWRVMPDGALRLEPGGGDLISVETFESFELVFEWRTGHRGNSGIMFRVTEEHPAPWQSGPEYQLLDDVGHGAEPWADWSAGSLYGLAAPRPAKQLAPLGRFNHGRIVLDNGRLEHWMNGRLIVEIPDVDGADFRQRIAESKFKEFEGFGRAVRGHLSIQDHGDRFEFRRIRVRSLPAADARDPALKRLELPPPMLGALTGILMRAAEQPPSLLFLGDDFVAGWRTAGRTHWERGLVPLGAVNLGAEGELPGHTLAKLEYSELLMGPPRAVIIRYSEIGRTDPDAQPEDVLRSIAEVIALLRTRVPDAVVLLHVPAAGPSNAPGYALRAALAERLPLLADGTSVRALVEGQPSSMTEAMYRRWRGSLERLLNDLGFDPARATSSER